MKKNHFVWEAYKYPFIKTNLVGIFGDTDRINAP